MEDNARRLTHELGISDKVIFAWVRKDIPQVLSAMEVLVMPSLFEDMPNVLIEAQAIGLPCIVSDTITREANISGLVEYLPLSMNVSAWAERILKKSHSTRAGLYARIANAGYEIKSEVRRFEAYIFEN